MLIANAIRSGIRYEELHDMDFVLLINILDAMLPKKAEPKPKYRQATQKDIDWLTGRR